MMYLEKMHNTALHLFSYAPQVGAHSVIEGKKWNIPGTQWNYLQERWFGSGKGIGRFSE